MLVFLTFIWQAATSSLDIQTILDNRVFSGYNKGIAAAVVTSEGIFKYVSGVTGSDEELTFSSYFEIGSITKVVTGTLFAESILREEVTENTLLVEIFPELSSQTDIPGIYDSISLLHLATHQSGIPSYPINNHIPTDRRDPWAGVTSEVVFDSLKKLEKLDFKPGTQSIYSNVGSALLAQALVARASDCSSYEDLVQKRFAEILKFPANSFTSHRPTKSVAHGHDVIGSVPPWTLSGFMVGAGGLLSNLETMALFAQACLSDFTMFKEAQRSRAHFDENFDIGLNWISSRKDSDKILWHNGGTGGFRSWLGCDRKTGRAAVVLTNSAKSVDDIGRHLVDPDHSPLRTLTPLPIIDDTMNEFEGVFLSDSGITLEIFLANSCLIVFFAEKSYQLLPDSDSRDSWSVRYLDEYVLNFHRDEDRKVIGFSLPELGIQAQRVVEMIRETHF